jgi:predicted ATPase
VALLRAPHARLVPLAGPGGIGKTRLALGVATHLAEQFEDGVAFIPLDAVTTRRWPLARLGALSASATRDGHSPGARRSCTTERGSTQFDAHAHRR